jgi:hypothetical protein
MSEAVYLAHEIEWTHALDRARLLKSLGRGKGKNIRQMAHTEFDPHAATELAELLERRLVCVSSNPSNRASDGSTRQAEQSNGLPSTSSNTSTHLRKEGE